MVDLFLALLSIPFVLRPREDDCCRWDVYAGPMLVAIVEYVHSAKGEWMWSPPCSGFRYPCPWDSSRGTWADSYPDRHEEALMAEIRRFIEIHNVEHHQAYLLAMMTGERRLLELEGE